jgi:carbon-monoxide dehydrogenase medium subunit
MYPSGFNYTRAATLEDAVALLERLGPDAKLIAGGQSLLPLLKLRLLQPSHLVDIGRVEGVRNIQWSDGVLKIGALVTHARAARAEATRAFPIVRDCAGGIADEQVRSLGTVGGALAEADPSSCWPTMLLALDAQVHSLGPQGRRVQSVRSLLRDAFSPNLGGCELLESVHIHSDALAGQGAFVAFKRAAGAYPTASVALQVAFNGSQVTRVGLSLGCVGPTPLVVDGATEAVRGHPLDAVAVRKLQDMAASTAHPESDNKGSADYKRSLVQGLVRRACAVIEARRAGGAVPETHTYYG